MLRSAYWWPLCPIRWRTCPTPCTLWRRSWSLVLTSSLNRIGGILAPLLPVCLFSATGCILQDTFSRYQSNTPWHLSGYICAFYSWCLIHLNIQHIMLLISGSSCTGSVPVYCQNSVSGSTPHCHMQNTEGLKDIVVCSCKSCKSVFDWMYLSIWVLWVYIKFVCVYR